MASSVVTDPVCCTLGTLCFELVKGMPAAFVALVIGLIAASIAYRQYRVAHAKLKLDLFDKRYTIFLDTWTILSSVVSSGVQATGGLTTPFNNLIPQAAFLFGSDIENYLTTAVRKWADLWALQVRTQGNGNVVQPQDIAERAGLERWFIDEATQGAKARFGKYLNFEKWR